MCMGYTKEQFEADIKADRELEMMQDGYDDMAEMEHKRKLHKDYDYLYSQEEVKAFSEAYEEFKSFCDKYDLLYSDVIGGL